MSLFGKFLFLGLIFMMYFLAFNLSKGKSTKAIEKILLLIFSIIFLFSIIFSDTVWFVLPKILGVVNATDAILYLFIIISLSLNFILLKKIIELESKLVKLVQKIALNKNHQK